MRANCWIGKKDMRVEQVPDPKILNRRDAIVKITSTAICGSDLHLFNGFMPTMESGDIVGHEFMGEVVEVGPGVQNMVNAWLFLFRLLAAGAFPAKWACSRAARIPTRMPGWLRSCGDTRLPAYLATRTCSAVSPVGRRSTSGFPSPM